MTRTDPIPNDWITPHAIVEHPLVELPHVEHPRVQQAGIATIAEVARRLGHVEVGDLDADLVASLAAVAIEAAAASGIAWQAGDDPPVALLRLIGKVARRNPTATGPHTQRLLDQLG